MAKYEMESLEAKIREKFGTIKAFADAAGLEPSTVSRLLVRGDWKASQMRAAADALGIPDEDMKTYFFTEKSAIMHGGKK